MNVLRPVLCAIAYGLCIGLSFTACSEGGGGNTAPGMTATAQLVRDINPGAGSSNPGELVAGSLFFTTDDGTSGVELWKSDGTASGTKLVKDIFPGPASSFLRTV